MGRWWRGAGGIALAVALVAGACSGDDGGGDEADDRDGATAALTATADAVRAGPAEDELVLVDREATVAVGDRVATDASGRAELVYPDGSLTRIDHDTTVEVVALEDPVTGTRIGLEVGRVWQRVERLSGSDRNEIVTPVAVASVRGTEYSVTCEREGATTICYFAVLEGRVVVRADAGRTVSLAEGQRVAVDATGPGGVEALTATDLADPWISENLGTRGPVGIPTTTTVPAPSSTTTPTTAPVASTTTATPALADADPNGTWAVTTTVTEASGVSGVSVGDQGVFTYRLTRTCQASVCQLRVGVEETGSQLVLRQEGDRYTGSTSSTTDCIDDGSGAVLVAGGIGNTVTVTIRPARARGSALREFTGTIGITGTPTAAAQAAGCGPSSQTNSLVGVR